MDREQFLKLTQEESDLLAGSKTHLYMHEMAQRAIRYTMKMNGKYHSPKELSALFFELIGGEYDDSFRLFPPFYTDFGLNIKIGKRVFINAGCCFQDQGGIEIGDDCLIGQQVVIATLNHDLNFESRSNMLPAPVKVGKGVWVGAHATILPGVTIGSGAVVGAGAVVTKNVPENAVVLGVPAKVVKYVNQ